LIFLKKNKRSNSTNFCKCLSFIPYPR